MTPEGPPTDLLTSGADDDPVNVARLRRRRRRLTVLAAVAAVVAALVTGRMGSLELDRDSPGGRLPAEQADSLAVLGPETEESETISLPDERHVLRIECIGPGTVLTRLEGRSFLQARCTAGQLTSMSRRIDSATAGQGEVLVSVSTVSTTSRTEWRVTVHPGER